MYKYIFLLSLFSSLLFSQEIYQESLIFPLEQQHNHGSSIVEMPQGGFLVCWFHGSGERKADDVVIMGAHYRETWSTPFLMADTLLFPDCNPVIWIDPQERLWLFWITVIGNEWQSSILKYRISEKYQQYGKSPTWDWQDNMLLKPKNFEQKVLEKWDSFLKEFPEQIPDLEKTTFTELTADQEIYYYIAKTLHLKTQQQLGWMTRIHPLKLKSGRWLLPLYTDAFSISIVAISDDNGETWHASEPMVGFGNIQPSLVERQDGTIVAYMRENGPRYKIRYCESKDKGNTWGDVTNLNIPNPGSSVECIALTNGNWVLVYNDTENQRNQLKVSLSEDEGKTWKWHRYLEKTDTNKGSFSYPSVIQAKNEDIHVTYSYHIPSGKSIKHVFFNENWIKESQQNE